MTYSSLGGILDHLKPFCKVDKVKLRWILLKKSMIS